MSTSYTIEPGYPSTHSQDEAWEELLSITNELRNNWTLIADKAVEYGADPDLAMEYAESYRPESDDLTIKVYEDGERRSITQVASGGGESRDIKEQMRRAFCLLVLEHMNSKHMNVSIITS